MPLSTPSLDDRRFQDLVDDAKRLIAVRCPEWTDHNVSDPGVTLVEAFAFMVDELFYRLNRVPDRLFVTFLDLIGVTLHPPTAATVDVVFWLTAPRDHEVTIPLGAEVGTRRTEEEASVVFATTEAKVIAPRQLIGVGSHPVAGDVSVRPVDRLDAEPIAAFASNPAVGDGLLFGLDAAAPRHAVSIRIDCAVRGVGVDPLDPPLAWEAWTGGGWTGCDVAADGTGGLNQAGDVVLVLPADHAPSTIGGIRAGWLRCRLVDAVEGAPTYSASPLVRSAAAATVGGVASAVNATTVEDEVIGLSEGVPGQMFALGARPVLSDGKDFVVEVGNGAGWEQWRQVDSFAGGQPGDRSITIDRTDGIVSFPPAVREADGSETRYGAVPAKGAPLRVPAYRIGGGTSGNVSAGSLAVVRTTIPFVRRSENRVAATGGSNGETVEQAKVRGPLALRSHDRAVTAVDYEQLVRDAAPGVARVCCIPAEGSDVGGVRVLVVPTVAVDADGRGVFDDLTPGSDLLAALSEDLDRRRTVGARVIIEPPRYHGVTVVASLVARPNASVETLRRDAVRALYRHLDPVRGGSDGAGWPFGRPVHAGEVYAILQSLPGAELVEEVVLFPADPETGKRGEPTQRIETGPGGLVFSFEHRIRVTGGV